MPSEIQVEDAVSSADCLLRGRKRRGGTRSERIGARVKKIVSDFQGVGARVMGAGCIGLILSELSIGVVCLVILLGTVCVVGLVLGASMT